MPEVGYKPTDIPENGKGEIKSPVYDGHVETLIPVEHVHHVKLQGADLLAIAFLAGVLYAIIAFKLMD